MVNNFNPFSGGYNGIGRTYTSTVSSSPRREVAASLNQTLPTPIPGDLGVWYQEPRTTPPPLAELRTNPAPVVDRAWIERELNRAMTRIASRVTGRTEQNVRPFSSVEVEELCGEELASMNFVISGFFERRHQYRRTDSLKYFTVQITTDNSLVLGLHLRITIRGSLIPGILPDQGEREISITSSISGISLDGYPTAPAAAPTLVGLAAARADEERRRIEREYSRRIDEEMRNTTTGAFTSSVSLSTPISGSTINKYLNNKSIGDDYTTKASSPRVTPSFIRELLETLQLGIQADVESGDKPGKVRVRFNIILSHKDDPTISIQDFTTITISKADLEY